jgi:hypothetical protein
MREKYPSAYRIFMNPHATDRQLIAASRAYWGYGEEGNRFGYAQSIESNVRRRGRPQNQMAGDARQRTVTIGRNLINSGYKIWEHPNFDLNRGYVPSGGRVGRHADRSFHYEGQALDIPLSHNSVARLDALYRHLNANRGRYGISELLWRVPGHHTHLHVAFN